MLIIYTVRPMKRLLSFLLVLSCLPISSKSIDDVTKPSENESGRKIEFISKIPTTPVRDQYKTSTCWSFSGISFLETELIRMKKGEYNLSEMFFVRHNYEKKADRYVRMHGKTNFAAGGEVNDVTDVYAEFGIVPETIYTGLKPDETNHRHGEMDRILSKYVETLVSSEDNDLSPVWKEGYVKLLDSYLGELPEEFEYQGQNYTPQSFAESLDIDPDDYVMITSFTHEDYYKSFILEIPDNWSWAESYNVPLDEFVEIVDSALIKGYSVSWAADVSENGFNFSKGLAVVPKLCYSDDNSRGLKKWMKKSSNEKDKLIFSFDQAVEELEVTPEIRQVAFDNFSTTDDHGMHILGLARDRSGRMLYYVKNSWGTDNPFEGYFFVSKPYFRYKTISIMVHKEAIPEKIFKKLAL